MPHTSVNKACVIILQPALSAYQRHLHHDIHGPEEPLPENLAKRLKSGTVNPLKMTLTHTFLPQLPEQLLDKQKSLTELREVSGRAQSHVTVHQIQDTTSCSVWRVTPPSSKRKGPASSVIRKRSSAILLQADPNIVVTRYSPPLESLTDPLEIVDRLKREPELGFLYLTPVDDHKSVRYNPYNLR